MLLCIHRPSQQQIQKYFTLDTSESGECNIPKLYDFILKKEQKMYTKNTES